MTFDEKLISLRKQKGYSQEELGNLLGVTRQTVSKWELGQTTPEMEKLIALSSLFNTSIDELLGNLSYTQPYNSSDLREKEVDSFHCPFPYRRGYEYISKHSLFGLPLVHVNIGYGSPGYRKKAKGIVAIGNIAQGVIAIGGIAMGVFALGGISLGLLLAVGALSLGFVSVGAIAVGLMSIGALAIGYLTIGAVSIGTYSFGAAALGSRVAVGASARGHIAIGEEASGHYSFLFGQLNVKMLQTIQETILQEYPGISPWLQKIIMRLISLGI